MTRILLNTLLAMLIVPTCVMAQKVYKAGTKVVLDMSTTSGMPVEATTTTPKTWSAPPDGFNILPDNTANESINATVYHKLEVAPFDMSSAKNIGNSVDMAMVWTVAFSGCKSATYDGGGWRLPTQRELIMLFLFQPAFTDLGIYPFDQQSNYWSATEVIGNPTWSYFFNFASGSVSTAVKYSDRLRARCVREIP